ncbi:hypothetical protein ACNKHR_11040 [Shigella flexneri]
MSKIEAHLRKPLKSFSPLAGAGCFPTAVPHDESYLCLKTALFSIPVNLAGAGARHRQPSANRRRTGDIAPGESNSVYP